jgi:large subunit ribosomal protein L4
MKLKVYNEKAEVIEEIDVNDLVFDQEVKDSTLAQYVYVYLSNQRQGNAHTKDRSEVAGSRKKPWRQKGTGRARVGTRQNPIWRGGGVAFGPRNTVNWKRSMNRKTKDLVFRGALSRILKSGFLKVVKDLNVESSKPLTKQAVSLIHTFNDNKTNKITLVTESKKEDLMRAVSNVPEARVVFVRDMNPYDVLNAGMLLIEKGAISYLEEKLGKK